MKAGEVNCILCKTLPRAFRNYADQGYFLEEVFPRYRTRFIALGSPKVDSYLDPEAVQIGLEIPINGSLNDRYAAKTSADVRRTLDMKRRGEFIGSFAPYGYAKDPENRNRLVPDPEAARVVGDIFQWYTAGEGKTSIAQRLNAQGIPNPTAYKSRQGLACGRRPDNDGLWSVTTVARILTNPVYRGTMVQGRQRVVSYKVHLLAGFLRCADCGKSMTRKTAKGIAYDTCSTYRRKSKTACTKHTIREDRVLSLTAQALGTEVQKLSRPLLFQRVDQILIREDKTVYVCPSGENELTNI